LTTIAWNFLVLGATAFGGPPVHIGMFKKRFVEDYQWLSSDRFAELFAMANCLPGPSSTQVAFAIGITQQGIMGGLLSGFTFIFPGAVLLTATGFGAHLLKDQVAEPKSVANAVAAACSAVGVALVFIAVTGLVKKQVFEGADPKKLGVICCGAAAACLLVQPTPAWLNPLLIFLGGAITAISPVAGPGQDKGVDATGKTGLSAGAASLIFVLYMLVAAWTLFDDMTDKGWQIPFLNAGMFVWGGGPVVLPMLMSYLTPAWIDPRIFLTGIALAEMMPGPVFNMSCFLGVQLALAHGWSWFAGTAICWAGLMVPGILLVFGAVPIWDKLRSLEIYRRALPGLNSAAVGLLVSTLFVVYKAMEKQSPWLAGSQAVALLSYAAVEMCKASVPVTVVVAGLAGCAWSYTQ